jgi:hypothetical protein
MADPIEEVLRLVSEGRLSAEEAAPVLDALEAARGGEEDDEPAAATRPQARAVRIEVTESGRQVVNLRVPLALGRMALDRVPGLSIDNIGRIREALDQGLTGPIVAVDDGDGSTVRIVVE